MNAKINFKNVTSKEDLIKKLQSAINQVEMLDDDCFDGEIHDDIFDMDDDIDSLPIGTIIVK